MKKIIMILTLLTLMIPFLAGCGSSASEDGAPNNSDGNASSKNDTPADSSGDSGDLLSGLHHVTIEVAGYGSISVELDADTAPITVTNFVSLAKEGFYDDLTFMRVIDGFMIQGGDPNKDCTGGSDTPIKGEFSANGVENNISHIRGTISMARSSVSNDSASSQFFIMQADFISLDGSYAAFGTVTDGMDIVDQICEDAAGWNTNSNGVILDEDQQPVITTITVID